MNGILIADDEYMIRKGLRAILERSDIEFTEICECEDGQQALQTLSARPFDLAIMDIRMPVMDGLTAIREALELESPPCFIILSGYDEFTYARQAIRFGVHDYLLKPVDMHELLASIRRVDQFLQNSRRNREPSASYARLADAVFDNELNYILLNMNLDGREIEEVLDHLGADFLKGEYRMMSFELMPAGMPTAGEQEALKETVMEVSAELDAYAVSTDYQKNILVIVPGGLDAGKVRSAFVRRFGDGFVLGISAPGRGVEEIRARYLEAVECKKYRLLKGGERVLVCDDILPSREHFTVPVDQVRRIQALVGTAHANQISAELGAIFGKDKAARYGVDYLEQCAAAINTYILDYYERLLPQGARANENRNVRSIYNFESVEAYLLALRNNLVSLDHYVQMLKAQYKEKNKVDEALNWLSANYSNPNLSMSIAANHVSLNYTYFSLAFRERTGMSFVNYLKKLRIEKARELLDQRKQKIGQVSILVGFQNPRLFSKTFREETGVTPAEYLNKAEAVSERAEQ